MSLDTHNPTRGYARPRSRHPGLRRVPVGSTDSTSSQSRDPTGTLAARKHLARTLNRGWHQVKQGVLRTVGDSDGFGLSWTTIPDVVPAMSGSNVDVFSVWLHNLQERTFENLQDALQDAVQQGYELGATQARARVGNRTQRALAGPTDGSLGVVQASAVQDLAGIVSVVTQQGSRYFSSSVLNKQQPRATARGLGMIVDHVGVARGNLLASYAVVRAHAQGTLDTLQALGVTHVGVIPEHIPGNVVHDHALHDAPVELASIKLRVPRPKPKPSKISRARKVERKLEQALPGLVSVVTAGDDKVCPICEALAEDGPYTLDEARGLIPRHVNCRCALIPYEGPEQP